MWASLYTHKSDKINKCFYIPWGRNNIFKIRRNNNFYSKRRLIIHLRILKQKNKLGLKNIKVACWDKKIGVSPNLMNLNCLPRVHIWISESNPSFIFNFESVVQIWTGSWQFSDLISKCQNFTRFTGNLNFSKIFWFIDLFIYWFINLLV